MNIFNQVLDGVDKFNEIKNSLESGVQSISVEGLSQIHKAHYLMGLAKNDTVSLIITDSEINAKKLSEDINNLAKENISSMLTSKEFCFLDTESVSREYEHLRLGTLTKCITNRCRYIVASIEAVIQKTIPKQVLLERTIKLSSGDELKSIKDFINLLINIGYSRCEKIEGYAQFSVRGDIVDVYPPSENYPIRIELWGDEIDSISYFDLDTQRRIENIQEVYISPALESVFNHQDLLSKLKVLADKTSGEFQKTVIKDINRINDNSFDIPTIDRYFNLLYSGLDDTIFSYINGFVSFCEYTDCKHYCKNLWIQLSEDIKQNIENGELTKDLCQHNLEFSNLLNKIKNFQILNLTKYNETNQEDISYSKIFTIQAIQKSLWDGSMAELLKILNNLIKQHYSIILMAGNEKTNPIIAEDLRNKNIPCDLYSEGHTISPNRVLLMTGSVSSSFEYPDIKVALISQNRASSYEVVKNKSRKRKSAKEEIKALSDISIGDLVVHENYGIGKFIGVKQNNIGGIVSDYITIQYAGTDVLSIPVTQLDMVSHYMGASDNHDVKLNKLSNNEWQKTKTKVRKSVQDMAGELIELYAKREKTVGFAFSPDGDMQMDFEKRFPYIETDDQLRSIADIKEDMEKERPMDRLLCGDVGFGKTEVALRAVFKCIYDGKQAVILVPTTVLAYQHFQTCLKRFEGFPIKIQLLSRFRTPKQQEEILKQLKRGEIDLVIGTHRLVQKDVEFKDLGLVVIDEEQRFGVAHKEKFKKMFNGVDILTLSATPIPRTLNMAMTGIRDMSIIEEAPQDRHPVQTYVIERNMGVIAQALSRELKRGGQAYFVHNRIDTISTVTAQLKELLPNARIVFAHGQMSHEQISEIWERLTDGEIDILVSTTIIETGIDVPNVNTIIIDNADHFGLSQLYQLKGRVGRSNRRAYAYMMFNNDKSISIDAQKRLDAIKEFTQFGSGFKIAMRDLEIRGAGSILGGSQHGHMEAVGYELYVKLLSQAISKERGEVPVKKSEDCIMDIQLDAYIPDKYISSVAQRLDIYKRIVSISSEEQKSDMVDELLDRYGELPKCVLNLLDVSYLRNRASLLGVNHISLSDGWISFNSEFLSEENIKNLNKSFRGRVCSSLNSKKKYVMVQLAKGEKTTSLIDNVLKNIQ